MKKALTSIALLLILAGCCTLAFAQTPTTGVLKTPYLIYPAPNATGDAGPGVCQEGPGTCMQVLWWDYDNESNTISWGTSPTSLTNSAMATAYVAGNPSYTSSYGQKYTINGLSPNTRYYYKVTANPINGACPANSGPTGNSPVCSYLQAGVFTGNFITAPPADATSVRFLVYGDTRTYPYNVDGVDGAMVNFYNQPGNADYQRLSVHMGDWVDSDADSTWASKWFTDYQRIVNFNASTPIIGTKGNHEEKGGYSCVYPKYMPFPYPDLTTSNTAVGSGTLGVDSDGNQCYNQYWWSFDYGPVHVTILDQYANTTSQAYSNNGGPTQEAWAEADMAAAAANPNTKWKILVFHGPVWATGGNPDYPGWEGYDALMQKYGYDMYIGGHNHNYGRNGVYNSTQADGDSIAPGIPYLTSGGGGGPLSGCNWNQAQNKYPHVITCAPTYGFSTFDIEGDTLTTTFYQVNNLPNTTSAYDLNPTFSPVETLVLNHFSKDVTAQIATTQSVSCTSTTCTDVLTLKNTGAAITGNVDVILDGLLNLKGIGNAYLSNSSSLGNYYGTTVNTSAAAPWHANTVNTVAPYNYTVVANNPACRYNATGTTSVPTTQPATACLNLNYTVTNATMSQDGEPMIRVSSSGIKAGATATVTLSLTKTNSAVAALTTSTINPIVKQE